MKRKKPNTLIGSWQLTVDKGPVYEGDTQERLDKIQGEMLKKGKTFKLIQTGKRRKSSEKGYMLYEV